MGNLLMSNTFIINLERSKDRYQFVSSQLNSQKIIHSRLSAANGISFAQETNFLYPYVKHAWRRMSASELGCLLSHIKFWKLISESNIDHGTILEDDVHIAANFGAYIKRIDETNFFNGKFDIIKFETTYDKIVISRKDMIKDESFSIHRLLSTHYGTAGYSLNKKAAKFLLDYTNQLNVLADHIFISREYNNFPLKIGQVTPALAIQDKYCERAGLIRLGFDLTIEQNWDDRYKIRGWKKAIREVRRIMDKFFSSIKIVYHGGELMMAEFFKEKKSD